MDNTTPTNPDNTGEITDLWQKILSKFSAEGDYGPADLALLRQVRPLGIMENRFLLAVPSAFIQNFVQKQSTIIENIIEQESGKTLLLVVVVDSSLADLPTQETDTSNQDSKDQDAYRETGLNPTLTFESFVIAESNKLSAAAAQAVAENRGQSYNPLFIYGGPGLGKTHMLHAVGNYALQLNPAGEVKVKYVSSEDFTNDFINAIRHEKVSEFQERYRQIDFLLIDDIQFLQGKEQTIEEFFHTFNTLYNSGKQVIITSDVHPRDLNLETRLRSRFEMGLTTDVQPPNFETRNAILRKKAQNDNILIPDEVFDFIAANISSSVRELEGALIRVTAYCQLTGVPINLENAKETLKDSISTAELKEITVPMILDQTAKYFGITVQDLCSTSRTREIVQPRQIAMYLCRELTNLSLPQIASAIGGKDHTTVMHANKKIMVALQEKREVFNQISALTNLIKNAAQN